MCHLFGGFYLVFFSMEEYSRSSILELLKKRHLNMSNIETLGDSELLRIYKTFVVPLARRETSITKHNNVDCNSTHNKHAQKRTLLAPMEVDTPPATPPNGGEPEECISTALYEKRTRHLESDTAFPDDCLSAAAKRIKIDMT